MTVLCLVERDADGPADASLRALTFAARLAGRGPADRCPSRPCCSGPRIRFLVTRWPRTGRPARTWSSPGTWTATRRRPGRGPWPAWPAQQGATAVIAAATDRGNEVMAYLGALTGLPMAANCVQAEPGGDGTYQVVRHRWAGLLLEEASLTGSPALMTVATEAVPAAAVAEPVSALPVHPYTPSLSDDDLRVRATETAGHSSGASLATARVVVGGGRGVGGPDGFAPLEELAGLLGGVVGVSRVVTSEGWRPHRQQVGQTGTKITPELYLACGISGAIQHMAGCAGAKHIVVVNTDAGAPILAHADYAVVGDLGEVIPALVAALRGRSA